MTDQGEARPPASVLAPVYGAGFVTAFGAHAVAANLGAYATGHSTSLWELGLLLGVYDGAEVVLKPVFGSVVDRRGAKAVMVAGLVAFAAASAAFAVAGSPHWLGLARLAQGCAAAAFSPAAGAAVAQLGGTKRTGRLFGGYGGAKSVGYLLGPVAGGALVVAGGYRTLFAVTGAVAVVAAVGVAVKMPAAPPAGPRPRSGVAAPAALVQPWAGRSHDRDRLPTWAPSAALVAASAGFALAVAFPGPGGICAAAVLVGTGVAVVTPVGFALLAAGAPPGRMGSTMGAGEVGRELGDAGGPVLVGAVGVASLGAGLGALAAALAAAAALALPARSPRPIPDINRS